MSWLKTISPMVLHQGSDLPYAILEDGIHLCYDNLYHEHAPDKTEYFISFKSSRSTMVQQSSNYFRFKKFPRIIPFSDIIRLNDSIIDGRLVKCAVENQGEPISAVLFDPSYLRRLDDDEFQGFVDLLDNAHYSFMLVDDPVDPQARLLDDMVSTIYASNWGRVSMSIANTICPKTDRKYCWGKSIPDLDLAFYGLKKVDHMNSIETHLLDIGVIVGTRWEG